MTQVHFPRDPNTLSTSRRQMRNRMRRALASNNQELIARERAIFASTVKPVKNWDMQELAAGRPRNHKGNLKGKQPEWVDAEVTKEIARQLHLKTRGKLAANVGLAIKVIVDILENNAVDDKGRPVVEARTKLAAATYVLDHILGKPTAILEPDAVDKIRQIFAKAIILDDGSVDSHLPVLEGVMVDEEEEEIDDDDE